MPAFVPIIEIDLEYWIRVDLHFVYRLYQPSCDQCHCSYFDSFFKKPTVFEFTTGQSLALLSTLELLALIVGSLVSGYLKNTISIKTALYASVVIQLLLLVGFATVHFGLILLFSSLDAFIAGLLSPRLQELVFKQIPEESMGAVQSSIGAITVVLPSLFTIVFVTIATSFGTLAVSFILLLLLLTAFVMLLNIRESI